MRSYQVLEGIPGMRTCQQYGFAAPVREIVRVPANARRSVLSPVPAELETVIVTAALVPCSGRILRHSVNAWVLLESVVVSSEIEYGEAVSCAPVFVPSTTNCTKDTGLRIRRCRLSV